MLEEDSQLIDQPEILREKIERLNRKIETVKQSGNLVSKFINRRSFLNDVWGMYQDIARITSKAQNLELAKFELAKYFISSASPDLIDAIFDESYKEGGPLPFSVMANVISNFFREKVSDVNAELFKENVLKRVYDHSWDRGEYLKKIIENHRHWELPIFLSHFQRKLNEEDFGNLVNQKYQQGYTPLQLAIFQNQKEAIRILLPFSDANQLFDYEGGTKGCSLLHLLAQRPDLADLAKDYFNEKQTEGLLLSDSNGCNILHMAAFYNNTAFLDNVFDYLNQKGVSEEEASSRQSQLKQLLEQKDPRGYTPLQMAILIKKKEAAKALLPFSDANQLFYFEDDTKGYSLLHFLATTPDLADLTPAFIEKQKNNLLAEDGKGRNILHRAAFDNNTTFLDNVFAYLNHKDGLIPEEIEWRQLQLKQLLEQKESIDENTPLMSALSSSADIRIIEAILRASQTINKESSDYYQIIDLASLSDDGAALSLILNYDGSHDSAQSDKIKYSADDLETISQVSLARTVAGLACSTKGYGLVYDGAAYVIRKAIKQADFPEKELISKIADDIFSGEGIDLPGNRKAKVLYAKVRGHAAYFIIESDENDVPKKISYCDGNNPLSQEEKFGEVIFDIDAEKLKNLGCAKTQDLLDLLQKPEYSFANLYKSVDAFDREMFDKILSNFAVSQIDEKDGKLKPHIAETKIPTKPQNRGNCSFKSFNITLRALMAKTDPTMEFLRDEDGNGYGKGYEIFKGYKKALINNALDKLFEAAEEKNKGELHYRAAVDSLKDSVFLWSAKKGNVELFKRVVAVLDRENVDLAEIVNSENQNVWAYAIANHNGEKEEILQFCVSRKLESKDQNILSAKSLKDLFLLFDGRSPDLKVVDGKGNNILHIAALSNNHKFLQEISDYLNQSEGADGELKSQFIQLLEQKSSFSSATPLQTAIIFNKGKEVIEALLPASDVNQMFDYEVGSKRCSLLYLLAENPDLADLTPAFIEKQKANLLMVDSGGCNIFHRAVLSQNPQFLENVLAYFQKGDLSEDEKGSRQLQLKQLLERKESSGLGGLTPLQIAILSGQAEAVKRLLPISQADQLCDRNDVEKDYSLLHLISFSPRIAEFVPDFIDKQKDNLLAVDDCKNNILHFAILVKNHEFLDRTLKYFNQVEGLDEQEREFRKSTLEKLLLQKNKGGETPLERIKGSDKQEIRDLAVLFENFSAKDGSQDPSNLIHAQETTSLQNPKDAEVRKAENPNLTI